MVTRKRHEASDSESGPDGSIKAFKGLSDAWPSVVDFHDPSRSSVPLDGPLFVPRPRTLCFVDYEPHQVLSATLCMRNQDRNARRIKVIAPESSLFSVHAQNVSEKVAPGMEAQFTVVFKPLQNGDHAYDLKFCTDRETFTIPLRAHGARPKLQLPDSIDFGDSCPCNSTSSKTVLVRNIGRCAGKFQLSAAPPFYVLPTEALLDVGETVQCVVRLTPSSTGSVTGTLLAVEPGGVEHKVILLGSAVNMDVAVSPAEISFVNTFVTKTTQRAFHIINHTSQAVKFTLHGAPYQKTSQRSWLTREPAMTSYTNSSIVPEIPKFGTAEISAFPSSGMVLPHSYTEVMLKFSPLVARTFIETCLIALEGQAKHQPVTLTGVGLGPTALFSYDLLDVGNIYIRTLYRYSVLLENRGDIPVPFDIVAGNTQFASMFTFHPARGTVEVEETLSIQVEVMANHLGRFDERISVSITGTDTQLMLQVKGRVIGPTCEISATTVDYGVVAYGFRYSKEVMIENKSEVPMPFKWRVENDLRPHDEFNLVPAHGAILPGAKQQYLIEFIPQHICRYNAALVLDMPGVQNDVLKVDIVAECVVPKLHISTDILDFGECPLDYPCTMAFVVSNKAKLPLKFVVDEQDPAGYALAEFSAHPLISTVAPQGEQIVTFSLRTKRLGNMQLPCRIQAVGSSLPPLDFLIAAKSVGPIVTCTLKESPADEPATVAFGRTPVMQSHSRTLCLRNISLIAAEVKVFITSNSSVFAVDSREQRLLPGACVDLTVSVRLDETFSFSDLLQILVTNGNALEVPLTAVGIGSTLSCQDICNEEIDFGPQIAGRAFSRSILVENHGRRTCSVTWQNYALEVLKKQLGRGLRGPNGKQDLSLIPKKDCVCFSVEPATASIPAKQARHFNLHGFSTFTGTRREMLRLISGQDASSSKIMLYFTAVADIDTPQMNFSSKMLTFEYLYHPLLKIPPQRRTLHVSNIGKIALKAAITAHAPFTVIPTAAHLEPGDTIKATITMNHAYRKDLVSHKPRKRLEVTFDDNPHVEYVELHGNINYPNVHLSSTQLTFASTLNDTITSKFLTVTNTCEVPVKYHWELTNGRIANVGVADATMVGIAANDVFDIRPVDGLLQPGAAESVCITFFAKANHRANASATLHVQGGPDTDVMLQGEAGAAAFHIEPRTIKCGICQYSQTVQRQLRITNASMVPFDWRYNGKSLSRQSILTCSPLHGTIQPGEKQTIILNVKPGIPCHLQEIIYFEMAHFEPAAVWIDVEGAYTSIALSLPRDCGSAWLRQVAQACARLQSSGSIVLQRILQKDAKYLKQFPDAQKTLLLTQLDGVDLFGRVCMAAEGLPQIEVYSEADRQTICDALWAQEEMELTAESCASRIPSNMQPSPSSPGMKRYAKVLGRYSMLPAVTASTYILDFGVVVKGTAVSKTIKIQNACTFHASVSADKGLLEAFGCTLQPDKLPRLPGLPDRYCTEVTLCLDTQAPQIVPGIVYFHLPLLVQNSPPVLVNVKAYVTVPELTCGSTELDFGSVSSGMGRVKTVRLSNPGEVDADWSVKKPAGDMRDWNAFRCDPASGAVPARSHKDIKIIFVPQLYGQRNTEYQQALAIKVVHGRTITLHASGSSLVDKVKIWPKELDLGAVHPSCQTAEGEFHLSNPGRSPIEVFVVGFDPQWAEEAKILSCWNGYREDWGFALLKPRGIGTKIWDGVKKDVKERSGVIEDSDFGDVVQGYDASACQLGLNTSCPADGAWGHAGTGATSAHEEGKQRTSDKGSKILGPTQPFIAIVNCFEAQIATDQAQLLAQRYSVPMATVDHLILEAGELDHVDDASGKLYGDMLYENLIGWEALDKESAQPYMSISAERRDQLIAVALQAALQQPKYAFGLVIVGTACEFSPLGFDLLLAAIHAVKGQQKCYVFDLHMDQQDAHRRYIHMLSDKERSDAMNRIEAYAKTIANAAAPAASIKSKNTSSKKLDRVDTPKFPPGIDPDFGERYAQHCARAESCKIADGRQPAHQAIVELRVIPLDAESWHPSTLHDQILGLHFDMDDMSIALPAVQADITRLVPAYDVQVVRRPAAHTPCYGRQLLSFHTSEEDGHNDSAPPCTRWVIQPGCTLRARVRFASAEVTDLSTRVVMMTQRGGATSEFTVRASCAYPQINWDPQRIFPRLTRKVKSGTELHHCYVMQHGHFDFGSVPVAGRPVSAATTDAPSVHTATLQLENNGKFDASVRLDLVSLARDPQNTPPQGKPGKGKKPPQQPISDFSVTPNEIHLEVGQTKSFKLSCFPLEPRPVQDVLRISVIGNPDSHEFLIVATGQDPAIQLT